MTMALQLIAMHGWCGDSRSWEPWQPLWQQRGWRWRCGERGYGDRPQHDPAWDDEAGLKLLLAHSLGPHLLTAEVLAAADAVVLLCSFGRFVPEGRGGRALETALAAMARELAGPEPGVMLDTFLQQVAAPHSSEHLQPTPGREQLSARGVTRLQSDLERIVHSQGLPQGFPARAKVLLVQAGRDQIVAAETRQDLEQRLPQADVVHFAGAGHGLIGTPTMAMVTAWIEGLMQP